MGRTVRRIAVSRRVSVLLLTLVTLTILLATIWLSGHAYQKLDPIPFREIRLLASKLSQGPLPMATVVALLTPMVLNILIFLPWGFLAFIVLDTPERPVTESYLLTFLLAVAFSGGVEAWQYFLPTRVMDINDVIANGIGALAGAILGHMRKRVRVEFE